MKKCLIAFFSAVVFAACTGGPANKNDNPQPNELGEQTEQTEEADSLANLDSEEEPMPVAADELFDDFIFNFAANRHLQLERIAFPLLVNSGHKQERIEKKQWKMERFFMQQAYYTLIFDSPAQKELAKDTALQTVTVEKIFLDSDFVRQYIFNRKAGRWMLEEIRNQTLPHNANASFLAFYKQFVTDSLFQHESLADQIAFSGPDPDDDFNPIEGMITPDFWDAFAPELPSKMLYNIVYGLQQPDSPLKILMICGISNGLEIEMTFHLQSGRWKLTKLIT